ncbi:MAG: Zn-dependent hydrolase [Gammaproteobacteria bacterium]|nr:Zn-dependent hydrolase [Gammaproteobacteria bacterium]
MTTNLPLRINQQRLWDSLMTMAKIGATAKGGCNRQALTNVDKKGRDLFVSDCKAIGCEILIDEIGNIFARREGTNPELPAVITGSHLDTQPTGGKFDGVFGVLAGLEVLRVLEDNNIQTTHPIEVVAWTNEEGSRFSPACMGSGVWNGCFSLDEIYKTRDRDGLSVSHELTKIGYKGSLPATPRPIKAAFEVHIEQGPILEKSNKQIGIVTGIQGLRWYELSLTGIPCHAGPTPMEDRQDPVQAMIPILQTCFDLARENGPWGRATIGDITTHPGSPNTVPESIKILIDLRHPNAEVVERMDSILRNSIKEICATKNVDYSIKENWRMEVTTFDDLCIDAVRQSAEELNYSNMDIVSGAGHDSLYVAEKAPTSMIFVPCENGLSHNEAENAKPEDLAAGANVLLKAILKVSS